MRKLCDCDHAEDFPHSADSEHCSICEHSEETVGVLSHSRNHEGLICDDCIEEGL